MIAIPEATSKKSAPARFKRGKFDISTIGVYNKNGPPREVTGYILGCMGVHKTPGSNRAVWTVAHLPSGLAAMVFIPKLSDAKQLARALAPLLPTEGVWNETPKEALSAEVRAIVINFWRGVLGWN